MNTNSKNKRVKEQYRDSYVTKSIWNPDHEYEVYPNMISGCHKKFSKHQEKSFGQMHILEYEKDYGLKIRGKADVWYNAVINFIFGCVLYEISILLKCSISIV